MRKESSSEYQKRYLPITDRLEEIETHNFSIKVCLIISALVILLIIWASIVNINEITVTHGEIVPVGKIPVVQHLDGGIVSKINIKNGDKINRNDILIELDATSNKADLEKLKVERNSLQLDLNRLKTFSSHHFANKNSITAGSPLTDEDSQAEELNDELLLLKIQEISRNDQKDIVEQQIAQREAEVHELKSQINFQKKNIVLLQEEMMMYESLTDKRIVSKNDYLKIKRELNSAQSKINEYNNELIKAQHALLESKHRSKELDSNLDKIAIEKIDELTAKIAQLAKSIGKSMSVLQRSKIRAPASGIVKGLNINEGAVISPSEILMEIIPVGQDMQVETRIKPKDIGHISIGDPVEVKISSYDYSRYGSINGKIREISASTYQTSNNQPYYKAIVSLDKQYIGNANDPHTLLPGMTVDATIITGEKPLLKYLIRPIRGLTENSFSER